ncbi:MAG: hypothetical protein L0G27_07730 [Paracoccus sp. (in: a-proteobacteria)]|nr:hypothetical protein [Paracoccus sp. (in: a-proteobacteria)]
MSDISASERRLSAALDRLDQLLDTAPPAPKGEDPDQIEVLTRQLEQAQSDIDHLRQAASAPQPIYPPVQDDDQRQQLDVAARRQAELSAANEELAAANRNLIEAQDTGGIGPDEIRDALEAEIRALRAAREAEIAQMGEIMAELERLLAEDPSPADGDDAASKNEGV